MEQVPLHKAEEETGESSVATSLARVEDKTGSKIYERHATYSHKENWLFSWPVEVLAATVSVVSVACMTALLVTIDGRPYAPWRMFKIHVTPNALLAILGTLSKSNLLLVVAEALGQLKWIYFQQRPHRLFDLQLFDEASRGAFGALKLLWTVNIRSAVASVGAVLTMLALALDPLTQQILSFPPAQTVSKNSTASIGAIRTVKPPDPTSLHIGYVPDGKHKRLAE